MSEAQILHIGFSGTRDGMSEAQMARFLFELGLFVGKHSKVLVNKKSMLIFHHGDCIGSDAEADTAFSSSASWLGVNAQICVHPPTDGRLRARCSSVITGVTRKILPAKPYLERNKDIVDSSVGRYGKLIATPRSADRKGGTWHTINYALGQGITPIVIDRGGKLIEVETKKVKLAND